MLSCCAGPWLQFYNKSGTILPSYDNTYDISRLLLLLVLAFFSCSRASRAVLLAAIEIVSSPKILPGYRILTFSHFCSAPSTRYPTFGAQCEWSEREQPKGPGDAEKFKTKGKRPGLLGGKVKDPYMQIGDGCLDTLRLSVVPESDAATGGRAHPDFGRFALNSKKHTSY